MQQLKKKKEKKKRAGLSFLFETKNKFSRYAKKLRFYLLLNYVNGNMEQVGLICHCIPGCTEAQRSSAPDPVRTRTSPGDTGDFICSCLVSEAVVQMQTQPHGQGVVLPSRYHLAAQKVKPFLKIAPTSD